MKTRLVACALLFTLCLSTGSANAQSASAASPVPDFVLRIARAAQALPEAAAARARGDAVQEFAR